MESKTIRKVTLSLSITLFLLSLISCNDLEDKKENKTTSLSNEKHVKYHDNGNISAIYYTDENNKVVNPYVHYDSLGRLKDSSWMDEDGVWEYQKVYSEGKLSALLTNYVFDDYLNMKYIKVDEFGDTVFNKSEYCEIHPLSDTINFDEEFLFQLICYSSYGEDILNMKLGQYDKSYKLIDSSGYVKLDLKDKDYESFKYKPVKKGLNKLRVIVEVIDSVDLNEDGVKESTRGRDFFLQHEFFVK